MVLENQRETIDPLLTFIAKPFSHINPNKLSILSVVFAFISGMFFYCSTPENELDNYYLLGASLFVFLNGLFDAVDGKVAKSLQRMSRKGDFLDHVIDRYADVFMICGLTFSTWCDVRIGVFALIGVLLTSYMGTQAQAVGFKREYSGLLGRADRLVLLMIIPVIQHIILYFDYQTLLGFNLMEWVLIYFAIMGNITALQRFYCTFRWFSK
jgi:archaetidylinositol phosphate synthase